MKKIIFTVAQKEALESGGSESRLTDEQLTQHLCDVTYLHAHQILAKGVPHKFDEEKQTEFMRIINDSSQRYYLINGYYLWMQSIQLKQPR